MITQQTTDFVQVPEVLKMSNGKGPVRIAIMMNFLFLLLLASGQQIFLKEKASDKKIFLETWFI